MAAFALVMKAREKYRRFFRKPVQPNICVLENIKFTDGELKTYMDELGRDLFTANPSLRSRTGLETMLHQFEEADNFGSLIRPAVTDVADVLRILEENNVAGTSSCKTPMSACFRCSGRLITSAPNTMWSSPTRHTWAVRG